MMQFASKNPNKTPRDSLYSLLSSFSTVGQFRSQGLKSDVELNDYVKLLGEVYPNTDGEGNILAHFYDDLD